MRLFPLLQEQPELILTDIFSGGSENLLTRVFDSSNELIGELLEVHDLQDYLYQILIPYLSQLPILNGKALLYDDEKYPAPIQIFENEREIGRLDIYKKEFVILPHEQIQEAQNQLNSLYKELDETEEKIQRYDDYKKHPLHYGDTIVKKILIVLNKKKYKKQISETYVQLSEYSLELEKDIISQKMRLEQLMKELKPYQEMQQKIAGYFRDNYQYNIHG